MADNQVKLNELGNEVLLKGLAKKDATLVNEGGKSFLKNRDIHNKNWVPSFDDIDNVTELEKHIERSGIKIGRESLDKILQRGAKAGQPVWKEKLENLFNFIFGSNPKYNPFNDTYLDHSIYQEMGGADGEPVVNILPATEAIDEFGNRKPLPNIAPATKTIIDDRLSNGFVGREFVFSAFKDFIDDHSNGYFTIIAEPGMGKSTIAAQYVRVRSVDVDCVCFFVNYRGDNTEETCIRDICRQLRELYGLADGLQDGSNSRVIGTALANYLQEISDFKLKDKRKLVIVIDALDEMEKSSGSSNICLLPTTLPKNIFFLLTRRPFEESEEKLFVSSSCKKQNFQMWKREYMKANNDDIAKYIQIQFNNEKLAIKLRNWINDRNISQTDFIDTLVERSNGNFMYICYVLPAISDGIYKNASLSELPNTLKGHYRNHVDRMYRIQTSVSVSKTDRKRIVAVFLESRDIKLSLSYIANVLELDVDQVVTPITIHFVPFFNPRDLYIRNLSESLEDSNFNELLVEEVENFNLSRTDTENRYQFYHKDFVDFLKKEEIEKEIQAEIYRKIVKRTNSKLTSKLKKSL